MNTAYVDINDNCPFYPVSIQMHTRTELKWFVKNHGMCSYNKCMTLIFNDKDCNIKMYFRTKREAIMHFRKEFPKMKLKK